MITALLNRYAFVFVQKIHDTSCVFSVLEGLLPRRSSIVEGPFAFVQYC